MMKYAIVLSMLGLTACKMAAYSSLNGSTADDISRYEKDKDATLSPRYAALHETDASRKSEVVKVGVFFSYDSFQEFSSLGADDYFAKAAGDVKADMAYRAFARLKDWFAGSSAQSGFLQEEVTVNGRPLKDAANAEPVRVDSSYVYRLAGYGPSLPLDASGKNARAMYWQVTLTVGDAYKFARQVGRSMGENNITILNGHFYLSDARNAEPGRVNTDPFGSAMDELITSYVPNQDARNLIRSQVYEPALDEFASVAAKVKKDYRLIVFNGCFSEEIENIALPRFQKLGLAKGYDLIGMRGYSNYRYFGPQMSGFFRTLAQGDKWTEVMANFSISKDELPLPKGVDYEAPDANSLTQGKDRVTPVLRNDTLNNASYANKVIP